MPIDDAIRRCYQMTNNHRLVRARLARDLDGVVAEPLAYVMMVLGFMPIKLYEQIVDSH